MSEALFTSRAHDLKNSRKYGSLRFIYDLSFRIQAASNFSQSSVKKPV